jgi:hypothetical protein
MADQQWGGIRDCCRYCGRSERTFRNWLTEGLVHSRLPSGRILVKFTDIDSYLKKFEISENAVDAAVDAMLAEMGRT